MRGIKSGQSHRILSPRSASSHIQLNGTAFLRRLLVDEGFPTSLFE